ncbi:hypothetical protein KC921_04295, partial [Candidatus Woesebacteria bacterium]|nr:hypothetical protein [Candidatus Woesebacteria bacterium]
DFDFLINKILIATDTHSSQNKVLIAHFTMISNIRTKDVVAFVQYIRETQDKIDWQEFVFTVGQTFPTLRRFVEAISLPDFIQYAEDPLLANQSDKNKALSYAIEVFLDARTDLNFALAFLEERSQQIGVIPSAVMLPFLPRIAFTYWRKQGKVESILDYLELKMDKYELVAPQITEMPDFCQMIFFDFPLSGLSDARFYQIVDDSVNVDTLTSNDREQLKDVVRGSGSVQAFLADKSKIKELIKKSSPMFAKQLLYSLLGTPFSNDSETFVMQDGSAQKRMELGLTCDIVFINGDASLSSEKMEELGFDLELVDRVQSGALLLSTIMRNSNEDPIEQLVNFFGDDEFSDGTAFSKFMDELSTELLDAPDTARAIAIRHRRLNRSRKVPSFKLVSYSKVMNAFYSELRSGMSPRAVNRVLETCLFLFLDLQKQFREVTEEIAPRIADFTRLVDEKFYGKGVWFSGRDGIPLFLAFKASHWGESLGTRESYKHILLKQIEQDAQRRSQIIQLAQKADKTTDDEFRQMTDERQSALFNRGFEIYLSGQIRLNELLKFFSISRLSTNDRMSESEKALQARLLKSSGITNSMIAADTGSSGTVISAAMNLVGGITREDMLLWGVGSDFDTTYQEIETLPKYSERTVFFDPEGQPFAFPTSPYQRMLAWATDQAVVRYFVPRETEFSTNAHELPPIQERVRKYGLDRDIEESAVEEALPIVTELHRFVYDNIAPTLVGFTDFVLRDVSQKDPPVKIVFAGRDGLVYFRAAKKLMSRFPERYTLTEDQLVYAFLTRKVISNNTSHEIQEYLAQLGISPEDKITLVDIGMYGTILDKLDQIEGIQIEDVEYLISRTSQANGYIDDETTKTTNLFSRLSGNPAVHFLEDTLSGEIQSPSRLIRNSAGQFIPDSYDKTYSFRERAMREFALQATEDYVDTLTTPSFDYDADKSRLLQALESTENFQHLMVPHER